MDNWAEIRRRVLVDGLSKRAACREYDVHWDTLAKILEHPEPPGYRRTAPRPRPKLESVPASKVGAELLLDVISTAYERSSVIVTTNLPFEQWPEVLGSERLTGAALDRLTHRRTILETGGESYRLRDARRRRRSPEAEAASPPAENRQ